MNPFPTLISRTIFGFVCRLENKDGKSGVQVRQKTRGATRRGLRISPGTSGLWIPGTRQSRKSEQSPEDLHAESGRRTSRCDVRHVCGREADLPVHEHDVVRRLWERPHRVDTRGLGSERERSHLDRLEEGGSGC